MSSQIKTITCQSCFAALDTSNANGNIIKCDYCRTSNVLPEEMRKAVDVNAIGFANRFYKALADQFSRQDLEFLMRDLRAKDSQLRTLEWDSLEGGDHKIMKCLALVRHMENRHLLQLLVDQALKNNPRLDI